MHPSSCYYWLQEIKKGSVGMSPDGTTFTPSFVKFGPPIQKFKWVVRRRSVCERWFSTNLKEMWYDKYSGFIYHRIGPSSALYEHGHEMLAVTKSWEISSPAQRLSSLKKKLCFTHFKPHFHLKNDLFLSNSQNETKSSKGPLAVKVTSRTYTCS